MKKHVGRIGAVLLATTATWLALALIIYWFLPATIAQIYSSRVRDIIQYSCGQFRTDVLIYTLRPGECRFANPEFDTRVIVDADGFRNAPEHLGNGPIRLALTGDSQAMGWGVEQHEKIASLLARDPRFTVRDLAMSSYGTPRELIAVLRHARDADVVVLQYCDNDRAENAEFLRDPAGFVSNAPVRAKAYAFDVGNEVANSRSTPRLSGILFHSLAALSVTWRLLQLPSSAPSVSMPQELLEEADIFARVLAHFKSDLNGKSLVVYDGCAPTPRPEFAQTFARALARQGMEHVSVLDLVGTIDGRDYFPIDGHKRAAAHAKIARLVLAELDKPGRLPKR